jgi:Domain of unknown function (DUF5664)
MIEPKNVAKRNDIQVRYDLLDWGFIEALAKIADYGAKAYGEENWKKSRLDGNKSPINHIAKHIKQYLTYESYDHEKVGTERRYHLASIAFNAMMEWFYEVHIMVGETDEETDE